MPPTFYWPLAPTGTPPAQSTPAIAFGSDSYVRMLKLLLPPGRVWNLEPDSIITKTLQALAEELARVDGRGVDLINESDPRTANETIADWEKMLSIPDDRILVIPATLAERQIAVTQKYVSRGGQNYAFFEQLCALCGYTLISIDKFAGAGLLRVDDRCTERFYSNIFAYAVRFNLETPVGPALAQADFERVISHAVHTHVQAMFSYS